MRRCLERTVTTVDSEVRRESPQVDEQVDILGPLVTGPQADS
jgi:hypothetical protein